MNAIKRSIYGTISFSFLLVACGGGSGGNASSSNPPPPPTTTGTPWTRYVGAHYTQTPGSGLTRPWAGGGLRDPGSASTNYKPELVNGTYVDNGYAPFQSIAIPEIDTLLSQSKNAVVTVGGLTPGTAGVFLDGISTQAGYDAYRTAITNRIDSIAALSSAGDWQNKIYFQFGNEISNVSVNGFYGNVCLWITRNDTVPTATCDLTTQFVPTYVEYYLAPGLAILQEKSQAMFGQPEAIQAMLGSIVNLSNRASFLDTLLAYTVVGTYAPSLAGRNVSDLVDAVSIHYTVTTPTWRTTLDNFRNQYFPGGVPATRVRALWTTEEVGVNVAENGYGMATALRGIARYLSWWQANAMSPDQAHVFLWGSDINRPSGGTCTGCTSVDQDMPVFYNFTGDNPLTEITTGRSTLAVTGDFESYEFSVEGQNKLVIIGFIPSGSTSTTTLTGATLNLSAWNGRTVSVTAYQFANQGPQLLTVTPASVLASSSVPISIASLTPGAQDAVVFLVQAQ